MSLAVDVGAVHLKNPVICASGEHVMTESGIRAALVHGAAVVVAKSMNESEAAREQLARTDYALFGTDWQQREWDTSDWKSSQLLCRSGLQPRAFDDWLAAIVALDGEAKALQAYVAASLILADLDHAVEMARKIEAAGVRLLEFNVGTPYGDEATHGGVTTERAAARITEQVRAVCSAVRIPVWVKLTGQSENVAALAAAAKEGGAAAVIMIGRSLGMLPDLDTMAPALGTNLGYGGGWALPLTCYWLARSRKRLGASLPLLGTNGARSGADVARMMLAGASAVELCTAVMTGGYAVITQCIDELDHYCRGKGVDARELIGIAADRLSSFDAQVYRPDHWQHFVPAEGRKAERS